MKQGDICLAYFPFTDASAGKLRPVLIVSADRFNGGEDVVVLPISSRPESDDPYVLRIDDLSPHFPSTGLKFSSAVKWSKPMAISKAVINRRLGKIPAVLMNEIRDHLISLIS